MNKKIADHINSALPTVLTNLAKILKENFDTNGQGILRDTTGTAAIIAKLFGQSAIDKYFNQLTEKKLDNYGLNIYVKVGFLQANDSLNEIKKYLNDELAPVSILSFLNKGLELEKHKLNTEEVLLIFKPKYHPAIISIKRHYENVLTELETPLDAIRCFTKHFNKHIEAKVKNEFGIDYEKHLEDTEKFRLDDSETDFLWDMVELGNIGFKESENLTYEQTFACWRKVSEFKIDDNQEQNNIEDLEEGLEPIQDLIEQYFDQNPNNHLDQVLFVLADFGKGKSVFLRHYASQLAKQYFETKEGLFPVYFNLRDFSAYSSETKLGVISDYLETDYSIRIDSDHFKNNNYIFLIDSLDESGDLTKLSIDNTIASVKKIQNIDKEHCRFNRIVISSRPFDVGLESHLSSHKPYVIKNVENRETPYFISIFGFKKIQFNHWMNNTIDSFLKLNTIQTTGFAKDFLGKLLIHKKVDFYQLLQETGTLSASELTRPIFAYMIYQLIINNIDFSSIGKIGVYLSFLNLLTKEAKHIHDINYEINLTQEFEFRNLLHAISSLWMYERQQGKQGVLKKADICRVLDGDNKGESDTQILERYNNQGVTEIQFLSHSYFGENNNVLHFQHQSFAEILLAEYYLKVFIKYALDDEFNVEEARTKLMLGEPTAQTIKFFTEILYLLNVTATKGSCKSVLDKRKLLYPLMASLATKKNNKLFCNAIYSDWFKANQCKENIANYPQQALIDWCIDKDTIDKIIKLARAILESKTNYILARADTRTLLYDKELLVIQDELSDSPPDIDRWLALLVGNTLYNDVRLGQYFNWDIQNFSHLFDLIKNWNYAFQVSSPFWGNCLFEGINMSTNRAHFHLDHLNIKNIGFSNSLLKHVSLSYLQLVTNNISMINIKSSIIVIYHDTTDYSLVSWENVGIDNWIDIILQTAKYIPLQCAAIHFNHVNIIPVNAKNLDASNTTVSKVYGKLIQNRRISEIGLRVKIGATSHPSLQILNSNRRFPFSLDSSTRLIFRE